MDILGLIGKTKFYSAYKGPLWKGANRKNLNEYENYLHEIRVSVDSSECKIKEVDSNRKCCGSASVSIMFKSTVSFIQGAAMYPSIRRSGLLIQPDGGEGPPRFFPVAPEKPDPNNDGSANIRGNTYVSTAKNAFKIPCEGQNVKKTAYYTLDGDLQAQLAFSYVIDITINLRECGSNGDLNFTLDFKGPGKPDAKDRGLRELTGPNDPNRPPFQ